MRLGIDRNRMTVRKVDTTLGLERPVQLMKHSYVAGLRGHIEALCAVVEGQNVGVSADGKRCPHLHRAEVHDHQFVIAFPSHKGEPILDVQRDAVRIAQSSEYGSFDDLSLPGIDFEDR